MRLDHVDVVREPGAVFREVRLDRARLAQRLLEGGDDLRPPWPARRQNDTCNPDVNTRSVVPNFAGGLLLNWNK